MRLLGFLTNGEHSTALASCVAREEKPAAPTTQVAAVATAAVCKNSLLLLFSGKESLVCLSSSGNCLLSSSLVLRLFWVVMEVTPPEFPILNHSFTGSHTPTPPAALLWPTFPSQVVGEHIAIFFGLKRAE